MSVKEVADLSAEGRGVIIDIGISITNQNNGTCKHATDNPALFIMHQSMWIHVHQKHIIWRNVYKEQLISLKVFIGMWNAGVGGWGAKVLHCGHKWVILVQMGDLSSIMHANRHYFIQIRYNSSIEGYCRTEGVTLSDITIYKYYTYVCKYYPRNVRKMMSKLQPKIWLKLLLLYGIYII